jgi:hypothetical protein
LPSLHLPHRVTPGMKPGDGLSPKLDLELGLASRDRLVAQRARRARSRSCPRANGILRGQRARLDPLSSLPSKHFLVHVVETSKSCAAKPGRGNDAAISTSLAAVFINGAAKLGHSYRHVDGLLSACEQTRGLVTYFPYIEPAVEGANAADGLPSAVC